MLTGKRYKLNAPTLAIESRGDERIAITLRTGETVEVTAGPRPDDTRMVDIRWQGRNLTMFLADLYARGDYIGGRTASA
jgi:hypothetical protein